MNREAFLEGGHNFNQFEVLMRDGMQVKNHKLHLSCSSVMT